MPELSNIRGDNLNPANIGAHSGENRVASASPAGASYGNKGRSGHPTRPPRAGASVRAPLHSAVVVVDPGPEDEPHLAALASAHPGQAPASSPASGR